MLNRLQLPSDVVFLIVRWRLRFKLSLRDLAEILLLRGLAFSHGAVRDWETSAAQRRAIHVQRVAALRDMIGLA